MRPTLPALLTLACSPVLVQPARAQCVDALLAAGAEAGDQFGSAVAVLGDRAVVGAPLEGLTGAAHVFDWTPTGWTEVAKLLPKNPNRAFWLGTSIGLGQNRVIVSDPFARVGMVNAGAVYVFEEGLGGWSQTARMTAGGDADKNDEFGHAIAVDGDRVLVGAPLESGPALLGGAAYLFEYDGGGWVQRHKLTPSNPKLTERFGWAVDLDGDVAIVSTGYPIQPEGAVFVFERSGNSWSEAAVLSASTPGETAFGRAVAVSGDWAIVGAPYDSTHASLSGAAYFFQRTDQGWVERQKFTRPGSRQLGRSVAMSGSLAVVGAPGFKNKVGRAHVLEEVGGSWVPRELWQLGDAETADEFASAVAISPDRVVAGAPGEDTGGDNAGAAYVLELDAGQSEVYCESTANSTGLPCELTASGSLGVAANDTVFHVAQGPPGAFGYLIYGSGQTRLPFGDGFLCVDPFHPGLFRLPAVLQLDATGAADRPLDLGALPPDGEIEALQPWSFQYWFRDPAAGGSGFNLSHGLQVTFCY